MSCPEILQRLVSLEAQAAETEQALAQVREILGGRPGGLTQLDQRVDSAEGHIEALDARLGLLALQEAPLGLADRIAELEEAVATIIDVRSRERAGAPGGGQGGSTRG